jgi:hypothetical protein
MRKSTLMHGTMAAFGALGTAWFGYEWRAQSARVAELERELAAHSATQLILPRRTEAADSARSPEPSPDAKPAALQSQVSVASPGAEKRPDVAAHLRDWQQREREMLKDPEYRRSQIAEGRRRFAHVRTEAIRVVGMTAEQADRVVDLWVERNLRFTELGGITGQPPSAEAQAALARAGDAEQAELHQLLGDEKYQRWNRYLASGEERAEVGQLRSQLGDSTTPLNDEQADALVEAIYSERKRRSAEYEEYVKAAGITDRYVVAPQDRQRWLDLEKEANERIHGAMAATLSRPQLSKLDEELAARLAPIEAALRLQLQGDLAKSD